MVTSSRKAVAFVLAATTVLLHTNTPHASEVCSASNRYGECRMGGEGGETHQQRGSTTKNSNFPFPFVGKKERDRKALGWNEGNATCDGCFCVPDTGSDCPWDRQPQTDFDALIPVFRKLRLDNPYNITCDPFRDSTCNTEPPLQRTGQACVVSFSPGASCPEQWSYTLQTYPGTLEEAQKNGLYVTHAESCGACSSLQDLAVYMEYGSNMLSAASKCAYAAILGTQFGMRCFEAMGFTTACAAIWNGNAIHTRRKCLMTCLYSTMRGSPTNGPPPHCPLSSCLHCDEVQSGPVFRPFAGRTRRNSGLLSRIVRPCSQLVDLRQTNPCDLV